MNHTSSLLEHEIRDRSMFPLYIYKIKCGIRQPVISAHWHEEVEILYSNCTGTVELDGQKHDFKPHDIIFVNKEVLHMVRTVDEGEMFAIVFHYDFLDFKAKDYCQLNIMERLSHRLLLFPELITTGCPIYSSIHTLVTSMIKSYTSDTLGKELKIKCDLFSLIYQFYSQETFKTSNTSSNAKDHNQLEYVKQSMQYMEDHYNEVITVDMLANYVRLSKHHFIRVFKDITGTTPINHLINVRINHSLDYLFQGLTITDTAIASGFDNVGYYIRVFKRRFSMTPKAYLKNNPLLEEDNSNYAYIEKANQFFEN